MYVSSELALGDRWAEEYHLASRNLRLSTQILPPPHASCPEPTAKLTATVPGTLHLPAPQIGSDRFHQVLTARRSCWHFSSSPLCLAQITQLLYLSVGCQEGGSCLVPSSGGLRSTTLYSLILSDGEVAAGLYRYSPEEHQLIPQQLGAFRDWFQKRVLLQPELAVAPLALIHVSDLQRLRHRYPNRAYRLALLDCGHVSQNLYLAATSLGLGCLCLSGYVDDEINEGLQLDGLDQTVMLITLVGYPPTL